MADGTSKCGLATPAATKCSFRMCTDITSGAAPGFCYAYSEMCINFGDSCMQMADCASYTL